MWNSDAPLELLKHMPHHLTLENLRQVQKIIDDDKYINSSRLKRDLCGEYAPFCKGCDRGVYYPCAVAYIRMKQAEGMKVEMDVVQIEQPEREPYVPTYVPAKGIRVAIVKKKSK